MKLYSSKISENQNMLSKQELYDILDQIKPLIDQMTSILKNRQSSAHLRLAKENLFNAYLGMKIALDEELVTEKFSEMDIRSLIINKSLKEAQELASALGYEIRVMKVDGDNLMGTMDFRSKRINVEVADEFVINIMNIG